VTAKIGCADAAGQLEYDSMLGICGGEATL